MAAMQDWLKKFRKTENGEPAGENLIEELREVRQRLAGLESYFALESDEDLLDAAIYMRESLEARERYLIRLSRERNMVSTQLPIEKENRERWIN